MLGWLFKNKSLSKKKTNLLVFLTPHIIKESTQLSNITTGKHRDFSMAEKQYVEGEIIVRFKNDVPETKALEIISQKGSSVISFVEGIKAYHLRLRPGQSVEDAIKEFSAFPEVSYAEPNYKVKISPGMIKDTPSAPKESSIPPSFGLPAPSAATGHGR